MTDIVTTLERCYTHPEGRHQLLMAVPYYDRSERILVRDLVPIVGVDAALWILETVETHHKDVALQFALACTRRVMPIWNRYYPLDERPALALTAAEDGTYVSRYASQVAMNADRAALMANKAGLSRQETVAHMARFVCDEVYKNRQSVRPWWFVAAAKHAVGPGRFKQWRHRRWQERTLRGML